MNALCNNIIIDIFYIMAIWRRSNLQIQVQMRYLIEAKFHFSVAELSRDAP